jgi:hypothetical protein
MTMRLVQVAAVTFSRLARQSISRFSTGLARIVSRFSTLARLVQLGHASFAALATRLSGPGDTFLAGRFG